MKQQRGFTLIEIMIVIAIIATLAAMAISSMLRSRVNANEMAAVAGLRTISTGAQNYYAQSSPHAYPAVLSDLGAAGSDPPYVDGVLASGQKQGYTFTYTLVDADSFTCLADPVVVGKTGNRHFYVDEDGKITANMAAEAGPGDPAIQ